MAQAELSTTAQRERRPRAASVLLLLLIAANVFGLLKGLTSQADFLDKYPRLTPLWPVYLLCPVASVLGLIAIWRGRRWGVWLSVAVFVMVLLIETYAMGLGPHTLRLPLAFGLLLWAVKLVWNRLR